MRFGHRLVLLGVLTKGWLLGVPAQPAETSLRGGGEQLLSDKACQVKQRSTLADASFKFGSIHDVVGKDGVLVISLLRKSSRFDMSAAKLKKAGIWPTEYAAADKDCLPHAELSQGCVLAKSDKPKTTCENRVGDGCTSSYEQAIAESHRRALVTAMGRIDSNWTAILEDDAVPVRPERWNAAFAKAWQHVQEPVKLVRLNWCHFPKDWPALNLTQDTFKDAGDFRLVNYTGYNWSRTEGGYNPGLCTSAYMVHRDIIPEMLELFPLCTQVDTSFLFELYASVKKTGRPRGQEMMLHLDAWGSREFSASFAHPDMKQGGIMVQDGRGLPRAH